MSTIELLKSMVREAAEDIVASSISSKEETLPPPIRRQSYSDAVKSGEVANSPINLAPKTPSIPLHRLPNVSKSTNNIISFINSAPSPTSELEELDALDELSLKCDALIQSNGIEQVNSDSATCHGTPAAIEHNQDDPLFFQTPFTHSPTQENFSGNNRLRSPSLSSSSSSSKLDKPSKKKMNPRQRRRERRKLVKQECLRYRNDMDRQSPTSSTSSREDTFFSASDSSITNQASAAAATAASQDAWVPTVREYEELLIACYKGMGIAPIGSIPERDIIRTNCIVCCMDMRQWPQKRRSQHQMKCFNGRKKNNDPRVKEVSKCQHYPFHFVHNADLHFHELECWYNPVNLKRNAQFSSGTLQQPNWPAPTEEDLSLIQRTPYQKVCNGDIRKTITQKVTQANGLTTILCDTAEEYFSYKYPTVNPDNYHLLDQPDGWDDMTVIIPNAVYDSLATALST